MYNESLCDNRKINTINYVLDAVESVVQIHGEGFDEEDIQSILDPRVIIPRSWVASGFFIKADDKKVYIVTNSHVARNATRLRITTLLTSEELFDVELVGLNAEGFPDIAVLQLTIEAKEKMIKKIGKQPYLEMGDSDCLQRGQPLKAIGYPFGMAEPNVSGGEITNFLPGDSFYPERLVTDAAINPGNSGGPALTSDGNVVGINTSILVNANNIGFVTPINTVKTVISQIGKNSLLEFSDLGIRFQVNSQNNSNYLGFVDESKGVIIKQVIPGGMLAKAGLQKNDILFKIQGFEFDGYGVTYSQNPYRKKNLLDIIRSIPTFNKVWIEFGRLGERFNIEVQTVPRPRFGIFSQPLVKKRRYINLGGFIVQEMTYEIISALSIVINGNYWREIHANEYSESKMLVITYVESNSSAENVHLPIGEILKKINGEPVYSLEHLLEITKKQPKENLVLECGNGSLGVLLHQEINLPCEIKSPQ